MSSAYCSSRPVVLRTPLKIAWLCRHDSHKLAGRDVEFCSLLITTERNIKALSRNSPTRICIPELKVQLRDRRSKHRCVDGGIACLYSRPTSTQFSRPRWRRMDPISFMLDSGLRFRIPLRSKQIFIVHG